MDLREELLELRMSTGMNRREFCDYFGIPYRTVQDWEAGKRVMPDYLLNLMKYKVMVEKLGKDNNSDEEKKEPEHTGEVWERRKKKLLAQMGVTKFM